MLIVGSGAVACMIAARLGAGGVAVTMLGSWRDALENIFRDGLQLELAGRRHGCSVRVTDNPADVKDCQRALLVGKGWQTEEKARMLAGVLGAEGKVLTLQNGLGNDEVLRRHLGAERVEVGNLTMGAALVGPGRVRSNGAGQLFLNTESSFYQTFSSAGLPLEQVEDLEALLWGKLVINSGINPVAALTGETNGALLEIPQARALMRSAALETAEVARARGVVLPFADPVSAVERVARQTADNVASMLADRRRGAGTEIESINGAVVRQGRLLGVDTPVNLRLYQAVLDATGANPERSAPGPQATA